jgi:epidermal growth factor receptor substrate 15
VSQTFANTFEYSSSGTALGTANGGTLDGASTKFNTVTDNNANGGSLTIDGTHPARGTRGLKVVTGTSAGQAVAWGSGTITDTSTTVSFRVYLYLTANPPSTLTFARWQSSGGTALGRVALSTAGLLLLQDAGGTTRFTFASAVPLNGLIRVEGKLVSNASTGSWEVKYFAGDSTSAIDDQTVSSINTNGAAAQIFTTASIVAMTSSYTFWIDEVAVSDVNAFIGPSTTPLAASISATDSASPTDTVTRSLTISRGPSDSASPGDSAGKVQTFARSSSDSASPADTAARALVEARTASDSASPSDSCSAGSVIRSRSCSDSASPSDSASKASTFSRGPSDSASPADSATRALTRARSPNDAASPTDSATRSGMIRGRTVLDSASPADLASRALAQARAVLDVAAPSDSATVQALTPEDIAITIGGWDEQALVIGGFSDSPVSIDGFTESAVIVGSFT